MLNQTNNRYASPSLGGDRMFNEELASEIDYLFNPEPDEDGFMPREYSAYSPHYNLSRYYLSGQLSGLFRQGS